jgi:hypothetical protein
MVQMDQPRLARIELQPARRLAWLLAAVHLGALLLLATLPMVWWAAAILAVLLVASALRTISRHALRRGAHAVTAMEFADREQVQIRTGDGIWHGGRLLGTSTIGASLAVLNIRLEGQGVQHVVITGDGINGDDFRRLRVWLRWGPRPAGTDAELP